MAKRILLLGGSRYALPVIKAAHELGCEIITCDYLPDNVAHRYSDGYENVSIVDKEAVLHTAEKLNIDGIMSFACDPGVVTAAYVAEKMGLPYAGSYESVSILQNKNEFRDYLLDNGFNCPMHAGFKDVATAKKAVEPFDFPIIVKPTDSAGSKGVTKVNSMDEFAAAAEMALANSPSKEFIVEEYIESDGYPSDSDCFSIDGKLEFTSWSAQRFDKGCENPFVPAGFTWTPSISEEHLKELASELQRLLFLLNMRTSLYNVETRVATNGKAYIMEVSPRGGGNRLAEMLKHVTGVDLIEMSVKAALGEKVAIDPDYEIDRRWAEIVLHSRISGIYKGIKIADDISKYVVEKDIWVGHNEKIASFSGANKSIGTMILHFDDIDYMEKVMKNPSAYVSIDVI